MARRSGWPAGSGAAGWCSPAPGCWRTGCAAGCSPASPGCTAATRWSTRRWPGWRRWGASGWWPWRRWSCPPRRWSWCCAGAGAPARWCCPWRWSWPGWWAASSASPTPRASGSRWRWCRAMCPRTWNGWPPCARKPARSTPALPRVCRRAPWWCGRNRRWSSSTRTSTTSWTTRAKRWRPKAAR